MSAPVGLDPLFLAFQTALVGRYSLERELGRGGMGVVYLAHEVRLDRPVAIKVLPPELAARRPLRERFLREARTAAKLGHPNIVPIYAVDDVEDFVFFVMAYVERHPIPRNAEPLCKAMWSVLSLLISYCGSASLAGGCTLCN